MSGEARLTKRWLRDYDDSYLRDTSILDGYSWPFTFIAGVEEPDEPVGYDGFGAPLYAHQIPAEGTE